MCGSTRAASRAGARRSSQHSDYCTTISRTAIRRGNSHDTVCHRFAGREQSSRTACHNVWHSTHVNKVRHKVAMPTSHVRHRARRCKTLSSHVARLSSRSARRVLPHGPQASRPPSRHQCPHQRRTSWPVHVNLILRSRDPAMPAPLAPAAAVHAAPPMLVELYAARTM